MPLGYVGWAAVAVPPGPEAFPVVLEPGICVVFGVDLAAPVAGLTAYSVGPVFGTAFCWARAAAVKPPEAAARRASLNILIASLLPARSPRPRDPVARSTDLLDMDYRNHNP
jgi:hypothetical protein